MATFGQRLRELRDKKDIAQKEIASLLGVSGSTIVMYEKNDRKPSPETIIKLAEFFGVSTDYLLGRSDIEDTADILVSKKKDLLSGLPQKAIDSIMDYADFIRSKYRGH